MVEENRYGSGNCQKIISNKRRYSRCDDLISVLTEIMTDNFFITLVIKLRPDVDFPSSRGSKIELKVVNYRNSDLMHVHIVG